MFLCAHSSSSTQKSHVLMNVSTESSNRSRCVHWPRQCWAVRPAPTIHHWTTTWPYRWDTYCSRFSCVWFRHMVNISKAVHEPSGFKQKNLTTVRCMADNKNVYTVSKRRHVGPCKWCTLYDETMRCLLLTSHRYCNHRRIAGLRTAFHC